MPNQGAQPCNQGAVEFPLISLVLILRRLLLACGVAWQACVRKGFTKEWRDVQLNQLKVVIYSILGVKQDIGFDKRIMAAERTAGIVTNQLLDLLSWVDARRQIHERIPLGVLSRMIETPLTTLHCESYF